MGETLDTNGIGPWIKDQRLARGLSLRKLAEAAGIAHSSLDKAEHGGGMRRSTLELVITALAGPDATEEELDDLRKEALAASVGIDLEIERIPDDEDLQARIVAYEGPNPILRASAATAREMKEMLQKAKEESIPLVPQGRGPKKTIQKID